MRTTFKGPRATGAVAEAGGGAARALGAASPRALGTGPREHASEHVATLAIQTTDFLTDQNGSAALGLAGAPPPPPLAGAGLAPPLFAPAPLS
jgi:hypothetical protein